MHYTEESLVFLLVRFFIACFALAGNLIVILTIIRSPRLYGRPYNMLIVQLAFSDLVVGIGLFLRVASTSVHFMRNTFDGYSETYCVSVASISVLGIQLSQLSVLSIAVDRVSAVKCPVQYKRKDPFWYPAVTFLCSFAVALVGVGMLFLGSDVEKRTSVCTLSANDVKVFAPYWVCFSLVMCTLIFVLYGITMHSLNYAAAERKLSLQTETARELARQKRVLVTITVVLASYFLCYVCPLIAQIAALLFQAPDEVLSVLVLLNGVSSGINAAINILIYGWKYKELRAAMIQFLQGKSNQQKRSSTIPAAEHDKRKKESVSANTQIAAPFLCREEKDVLL